MDSIPLWLQPVKPMVLPALKVREGRCGHQMYYLDPHQKCKQCRKTKCDFRHVMCEMCKKMIGWAQALCRKVWYGK